MNTCETCQELNEMLKSRRITKDKYNQRMTLHNDDELEKLKEQRLKSLEAQRI